MPVTPDSQDDNLLVERQAGTLTLPFDEEYVYEKDVPVSPYVISNTTVLLYTGETLFIEAEEIEGKLFMQAVKENRNPEKTITLSFAQNVDEGRHQGMTLIVRNPFPKDLTYSAAVSIVEADKLIPTSSVPVMAGLVAYESWPDIISAIFLKNWKFEKENLLKRK